MVSLLDLNLEKAQEVISNAKHITAFTGAGISVESGIPTYRGKGGLWTKYDTKVLEINYFIENPKEAWEVIREIFYDYFGKSKPNPAHLAFAEMERNNKLHAIITQNIDNLHYEAGNKVVYEFHGNSKIMICTKCAKKYKVEDVDLNKLPPKCTSCKEVLKPDFIFFGEGIPQDAYNKSFEEANKADVFILVGVTGLVQPAASIPKLAKQNGATIIEINTQRTVYSDSITDIFLQGKAGEVLPKLTKMIFN